MKEKKIKKETIYLGKKAIVDFYYCQDKIKELEITKSFAENYKKLIKFFNVKPPKLNIKFIYTRKEMDKHWGRKSEITAMVDNKNPYVIYIFSPLVFERLTRHSKRDVIPVIIHETAHAFVTKINKRCFAWVNEGICQFVEKKNLFDNVIEKKNWQWFKDNNILINPDMPWRKTMRHNGYKISYNLVKYILKNRSKQTIIKLIKIRRIRDKNLEEKISKILDKNTHQFMDIFEKTLILR